jgi:hypothetical protein
MCNIFDFFFNEESHYGELVLEFNLFLYVHTLGAPIRILTMHMYYRNIQS